MPESRPAAGAADPEGAAADGASGRPAAARSAVQPAARDVDPGETRMLTALVRLHRALQDADLPFDVPGVDPLRESRSQLVDQLGDYLIPRMMTVDAPLLTVVGGSTGAGKSTLVNSLVGRRVTEPGVLRPTTRSPVLVHHPDDAAWFGQDRLLPDLRRLDVPSDDPAALQLVPADTIPRGLAILDAPDVDSVDKPNRELAAQLFAAADLWLFVTSAARYADQVPWESLRQAAERSTAVAVVLDRTHPDAIETVATHLARLLASRGLKDTPLFGVAEGVVDDEGLLPADLVADVRGWLESLASDVDARSSVVRASLEGSIKVLSRRSFAVADANEEQQVVAGELRAGVERAYDETCGEAVPALTDGSLLRGELLARWQDFVGTGELLRSLDTKVGVLRERLVSAVRGKPQQADRVVVALESALETVLVEHAEAAAERAAARWAAHDAGRAILDDEGGVLGRASADFRRRAERSVRAWQQGVSDRVREESGSLRTSARFLAYGVSGLGVSLMVTVLAADHPASTGDGAADPRGGSARVGRKVLEAVLGAEVVGGLVAWARADLERRAQELLDGELGRYLVHVDVAGIDPGAAEALRTAARRIDDLRVAQRA